MTIEQKALKKAITPLAKQIKNKVKASVPKLTGALRFSIDYKIIGRKGTSKAVVGVKSRYARMVKGKEKIPNKYAIKVGVKDVLLEHINQQTVNELRNATQAIIKEMLEKAQ